MFGSQKYCEQLAQCFFVISNAVVLYCCGTRVHDKIVLHLSLPTTDLDTLLDFAYLDLINLLHSITILLFSEL